MSTFTPPHHQLGDGRIRNDWFRIWMPYYFQPMTQWIPGARKHVYLPVNRLYKPLGISGDEFVNYEEFESHFLRFTTDPLKLNVWHLQANDPQPFYLYNDGPCSTDDYGVRLHELMLHVDKKWRRESPR